MCGGLIGIKSRPVKTLYVDLIGWVGGCQELNHPGPGRSIGMNRILKSASVGFVAPLRAGTL